MNNKQTLQHADPDHNVQLAIETTGRTGSIAVLQGEKVLRQVQLDPQFRIASSLAPTLDETLSWCLDQDCPIEFVSIAHGPGSFTGLRVGVTTAKTLCYATGLPLLAIDSVLATATVAMAQESNIGEVLVGLNAYRNQVFAGRFRRDELLTEFDAVPPNFDELQSRVEVVDQTRWQTMLVEADNIAWAGDEKMFPTSSKSRFIERSLPDAVGVGLLGFRAAKQDRWCDPLSLVPRYLKLSAAEEKFA